MRFCLVSTQKDWGGGEALLWAVGVELTLAGHSVGWIARGGSEVAERLAHGSHTVLHLLRGRGLNGHDWFSVLRAIRAWVPDVILLNDTHAVPIVGSASWFCRSPKPLRLAYKHTVFPLRSKLKYRLLSDRLICVSQAARETLVRGGLPRERSLVIYGGCKPPTRDPLCRQAVRGELGVTESQTLVVCVGNLLECKGHRELAQATAELVKSEPQVLVVVAGEGPQRANLERQIQQLALSRQLRLLGYREDAERLLAAADLVVHPSHAEGLSLVLIQAQMLGKPIVATAVGGTIEVLQAHQPTVCTSWIAQAKNPSSLAEQMRLAIAAVRAEPEALARQLEKTAQRACTVFEIGKNTRQLAEECARLRAS